MGLFGRTQQKPPKELVSTGQRVSIVTAKNNGYDNVMIRVAVW